MPDIHEDIRELPRRHFKAVHLDPPWDYEVRSEKGEGRGAIQHYDTMTLDDIMSLDIPIIAAKDCVLFLWTTDTHMEQAFSCLKVWGFKYKTVGFYWVKLNKDGTPYMGLGHWTRANPETCLLATRGTPHRMATDVRRLIMAPRREHSRKPDETYEGIMQLVRGPYVDLFGRSQRPGWTVAGNQSTKFSSPVPSKFAGIV